jgi:hypothetical protein
MGRGSMPSAAVRTNEVTRFLLPHCSWTRPQRARAAFLAVNVWRRDPRTRAGKWRTWWWQGGH